MVGRRMSPGPRDLRPMPPPSRDSRMVSPRDSHAMPPARDAPYPPAYQQRERMKRDFRKPSPDMRRPRSRSMSPPPKKRHPPPPHGDVYRGPPSPQMRRRRSFSPPPPPPPPPQMRRERSRSRSRSRTPPRKQRAASPQAGASTARGSRAGSAPRSSHGHRGGSSARDGRESHRSREAAADGQPGEFYGPWGTRITIYDLKKITVDIKRTVPKNKRSSSPIIRRIINPDDIALYRRSGEGSRPVLDRPELQAAVNRRFDEAPAGPQEPRVVAIIREPSHAAGDRREATSYERRSRSRERGYMPQIGQSSGIPVGERIDRERSERTQRQVAKLEQMEVAIDRKLEQIQRYERKYEETLRDEKFGEGKDERKLVDRSVRDRLGPRRDRAGSRSPKRGADRDRDFEDRDSREPLPDFSQRPDKPPIWGEDAPAVRQNYYNQHENGYRGRGRGGFRGRGRGFPRGRGRFSPQSWQHDKYEAY